MSATNFAAYKSPTAFEKLKKAIALEIEYLPDTIRANPIKSSIAGAALLGGIALGTGKLHDHLLETEVKAQLTSQTSHQAHATTFGVHRFGTIFNGVAVKKLDENDVAGRLINEAAARYVPAGDNTVGCKVVTVTADSKSLLSYAFGTKATVTTFNHPAFANGEYSCHGMKLEPSLPGPLNSGHPKVIPAPLV